jgi:hypothetical protein
VHSSKIQKLNLCLFLLCICSFVFFLCCHADFVNLLCVVESAR